MNSKCLLLLALASFGASAAPVVSTAGVGFNNFQGGHTVSETVVTPFQRTDSVSTPCGHSVVRTTSVPFVPYGISGAGFLGHSAGVYPGIVAGTGAGVYPGVVAGGLVGAGAGIANGFVGTGAVAYPGVVAGTVGGLYNGVGGLAGSGIIGSGFGGCL